MIVILLLLAGVTGAVDPMVCSLHGQGHVLMTDGSTRYTLSGSGLANIYSTTGLDVQCDFNQTASDQSTLSSCRFLISSATSPCSVDIAHGNQPGQVTVWGQTVSVTALEEFVSANVDSALGLACHAIDDDTITIEITQRDAERFILIESSLNSLTITTSNVTSCSGAFGTCQGPQTAPRAETIAVMPFRAIAPQRRCGSSTVSPIAPPYPSVSPYTESNGMAPIPAFASPEIRNQVIADCSSHDQARMMADSLFSGFVEACADDIALGATPAVAKANMDTFVKVIENRQKVEMAAEALQRNPAAIICAACMNVEWDNPVNTSSVLDASKVVSSISNSQRAKSHAMYKKPTPSASHNLYEKRPSVASQPEMGFPKSTPADLPMTVRPVTTEPTTAPMPSTRSAGTDALTTQPQSSTPQSVTNETYPSETQMPLSSKPGSNDFIPTHKPLYEHSFKPNDDGAMPSSSSTPSPSFSFPASPVGYEMPTTAPGTAADAQPATSAPTTAPTTASPMTTAPMTSAGMTTAPIGNVSNAMTPTPAPTTGFSAAPASQQPITPTSMPMNTTSGSGSNPQNPVNSTMPQPSSSSIPTPSPSGNGSMPDSQNSMPNASSTTGPTPSPSGNQTMGQTTPSTPSPSSNSMVFTPVPPPSPTSSPSATAAALTPVPPPSPTPAPTSSAVAAISSTPMPSPSSGSPTGNNSSPLTPTAVPTPAPSGQQALGTNITTAPTMAPAVPTSPSSANSSTPVPSFSTGNPSTPSPSTSTGSSPLGTTNFTTSPSPSTNNASEPATTVPSSAPGATWPSSSAPNSSNPTVVPIGTPTTAPTNIVTSPWSPMNSTTWPTNNTTVPWTPSYSPMGNALATPAPTANGTSAMGASVIPPPSSGSTRPPITALPITLPFIIPSSAPLPVELPYQPFMPSVMPATTAPLTGRGSVYGCHCNMSNSDLKDSLDKVQYALDSFLVDALTKSVLNGDDHNLLTVIACGLGGPNNANIQALSISESEASNMCRQCEYGSSSNTNTSNDRRTPTIPIAGNPNMPTGGNPPSGSNSNMYANARRTRNIGPVSGMNSGLSKDNAGATPIIGSSMPTAISNPSSHNNGAYPNREGSGMIPVFGSSRVRSQAYTFLV